MEKYWCSWKSRYVYKTDKTCLGKRVYKDIAGAQFGFTPEQEARLKFVGNSKSIF